MLETGDSATPVEIANPKQARDEASYGYEGLYIVPDNLALNALVNAMGESFAFNKVADYVPKRAADYAHPNPRLGQLRNITVSFSETEPGIEGLLHSELAISLSGALKVIGYTPRQKPNR